MLTAIILLLCLWQCSWSGYGLVSRSHANDNNSTGMLRHHHASLGNQHSDCRALIDEIQQRRQFCLTQSKTIAEIMTLFSTDYNFMLPFLVHHLSLGFNKIWIYNNDETGLRWYQHPTITCLLRHELIVLQPWPGEAVMHRAWSHWIEKAKALYSKDANYHNVWMSFLDIDEYLLIHDSRLNKNTSSGTPFFNDCIGSFLDQYPQAPEISFNWAFFLQPMPLTDFATTGRIADLSPGHVQQLHAFHHKSVLLPISTNASNSNPSSASDIISTPTSTSTSTSTSTQPLPPTSTRFINTDQMSPSHYQQFLQSHLHSLLPFETNFQRWYVSTHVKSITRLVCLEKIYNQHFGALTPNCAFGANAINPQGQTFSPTYAVDLTAEDTDPSYVYSIAQLNHYWALSLQDFVRKSHRGHRGVFHGATDQYRGSDEYMYHAKQVGIMKAEQRQYVNDTKFMEKYGAWFHRLRMKCTSCLDSKWFDDRLHG